MRTTLYAVLFAALLALAGWVFWPYLSPWIDEAKTVEPVKVRKFNPLR